MIQQWVHLFNLFNFENKLCIIKYSHKLDKVEEKRGKKTFTKESCRNCAFLFFLPHVLVKC